MEPLSALSPASPSPRATPIAAPDLGRILRDGQLVQGEVLQSFAGGGVLVGLGRHRVPADAAADARPGDRLWFAVRVGADGAPALRAIARAGTDGGVARALNALVGEVAPRAVALSALAAALAAHAATGQSAGPAAERLRRAVLAHAFRPGDDGAALAELLSGGGTAYEARLAASAPEDAGARAALERDLKALAFAVLDLLPEGAARSAAVEVLRCIAAEQLANLVRHGAGEAPRCAVAVSSGGRDATAYLEVDPRREPSRAEPGSARAHRVALTVELERLGPVRAEVASFDGSLAVRVEVGTGDALDRLRAGAGELRDRLAQGGAHVHVAVAPAPACERGDVTSSAAPAQSHVVDLAG